MWSVHDVSSRQVFFHYDKGSRSQKTPVSLLRNYQGTVQSDGYEAYSIYEDKQGVLLPGCRAHARRKFENALGENREKAGEALDYSGLLYQVEANLYPNSATVTPSIPSFASLKNKLYQFWQRAV